MRNAISESKECQAMAIPLRDTLLASVFTLGMAATVLIALILTFSRGAMVGLACALLYVTVLRYRRLLPYLALVTLLILLLPITQGYVARFAEGFLGQDLATQMRFGEYRDALTLISRYPM